jgi:hypothetical protein
MGIHVCIDSSTARLPHRSRLRYFGHLPPSPTLIHPRCTLRARAARVIVAPAHRVSPSTPPLEQDPRGYDASSEPPTHRGGGCFKNAPAPPRVGCRVSFTLLQGVHVGGSLLLCATSVSLCSVQALGMRVYGTPRSTAKSSEVCGGNE